MCRRMLVITHTSSFNEGPRARLEAVQNMSHVDSQGNDFNDVVMVPFTLLLESVCALVCCVFADILVRGAASGVVELAGNIFSHELQLGAHRSRRPRWRGSAAHGRPSRDTATADLLTLGTSCQAAEGSLGAVREGLVF